MDSLSRDLVKSFAEVVNEPKQKEPVRYVRGTITGKGDAKYVQLDGSTVATPISEVVDAQEGDRVLVSIENHRAVIVGNFTFSPSARQEQEALEKAEGAENTANSAGETANAAQLAAQEASKNANEAMGAASAASASAAEAKDQAADAMVAAGNVEGLAQEAKENATQANENATQAKNDAAAAQAAVANANEEIGKINDAIETAQGDIDEALDNLHSQADEINVIKRDYSTKVETENVKAELSTQITESVGQLQTTIQQNYYTKNDIVEIQGNLQSQITQNAEGLTSQATKVEKLESDTAEAQKQVDQALEKANSAQQAATQAQQDAEAATEAAETAQTEAATAAEKAQNANDAALDAKLAAHVADKALADAREALDQAREKYKNVVSNPGSTAEDIATAAAQVETARQAVETALEDAAEAQYVANKAQEAADVAQEEANAASQAAQTAQNKADAAEQAANNAQAAAEQAAENVAALTKRVTTAETKIDQNAEQISLNATKTEEIGDKLVNDYYSKTETDALIKVESDRITSTVSKVETVEKDISQIETRITSAEQKITDDAIVTTVRKSTLYKNDLNGKVNSTEIISTINQTAEAIKIQASKIKLEGLVTANSYFKILTNGSIEAVNGKFTGTITATSGTIGGWTIQKDSLTCVSHNDGFNVTYTTYIDANNGLIKFLSTSNDYETIISINGMEMHAGRQDGDRWIYDDIYYGVNGISKSGNMTGQTFSLDANGVSFGLTHNLVSWRNGGGYLSTNNEVNIGNSCRASTFYAGQGNLHTIINNNWIGFYRASDGGRVGWMGADGTNDLYISPEKGTCRIGSNLYVASDASRGGYYLQINSGGGTYAGNGYIFVNSSNGYLALGQGDAYVGSSGGRLYLKPQNQVTYDMFVEPRANRKTTLGSSGKRFYRLYTGLAVDVSSDRRIKEDFTTFDDRYLRLFELLQPTIYKLKYLPEDKSKIGGFIAQDVEEAMKQCGIDKREFGIYKYDSENDEYSLIYDMFIPLTVHYVQEQSKLVNHLKNEVALLKSKINI